MATGDSFRPTTSDACVPDGDTGALPHEGRDDAPETAVGRGFALTMDGVLGISSLVGLALAPFLYHCLRPSGASGGIDWSAAGSVSAPGILSAFFSVILGVHRRLRAAPAAPARGAPWGLALAVVALVGAGLVMGFLLLRP